MSDIKMTNELLENYDPQKEWEKIQSANELINTIPLKGKEYAEVKERVIAFRRVHPLGQIITDKNFGDNYVEFVATIVDENGIVLAKGHSREYLKTESAIEKCETSSVGRGLGFAGYGINTSIASAEDMQEVGKSEIFDEPPLDELINKASSLLTKQEQVDLLNVVHKVEMKNVPSYLLQAIIRYKEDEKYSTK